MPLELLLDRVEPVVEVLHLSVQPDELGHQCCQRFFTQGCGALLGDRCCQALDAAERAGAHHSLVLWYQSTTASAGAIKLLRTLRTQARAILCMHSGTDGSQAFPTLLTDVVHDLPPHTRRDRCFGRCVLPHAGRRLLMELCFIMLYGGNRLIPDPL